MTDLRTGRLSFLFSFLCGAIVVRLSFFMAILACVQARRENYYAAKPSYL